MSIDKRIAFYASLSEHHKNLGEKYRKRLMINSSLRLLAFVALLSCPYFLRHSPALALASTGLSLVAFLFLVLRHNRLSKRRSRSETICRIAENEMRAFQFDFSCFDGAAERINPAHDFSFDLDLFGEKSLFQQVNRTALLIGKESLINLFEHPMSKREGIETRQQAVKELTGKEDFCIEFRAIGAMADDTLPTKEEAEKLFRGVEKLSDARFWKISATVVPFAYILLFALSFFGMPGNVIVFFYLLTLALSFVPMKQIGNLHRIFERKIKILEAYSQLFGLIEDESFKSADLNAIRRQVSLPEKASKAIAQIISHCRNLNQSFGFPIMLLLNPFLMWNVRFALKIGAWTQKYRDETGKWFSALAKTDAMISLATFAANHPDYAYPSFSENFRFDGEQMGHPLIAKEKCVKNNIRIVSKPYFMIVTGANMAGKSTYLRTVGVNHLLASMGLPACAEKLEFYPGNLLTNLRTADSLVNNESYFFAELKRLKMIIERLKSGEDGLFIILDEILKGTNSEDKQKGSFSLMKRLVELGGNGIIATHDLALGTLEEEFPGRIKNFHFDANISGDSLSFDYTLHEGIAQNMNASFLMRSMGIVE
ncbi:MAG: hypothetical protein LBS52_06195 [Dysgonamonadaceae bacterium]|jgi:hypothetical protein|nr:hypothetical protein [Dysgonamonadaceae bacterium]